MSITSFDPDFIKRLKDNHSVYLELDSYQTLSEEDCHHLLAVNGLALQFMQEQTANKRKIALSQNYKVLRILENPSVDEQVSTVREEPIAIKYLAAPAVQTQLESISRYTYAIDFILGEIAEEAKALAIIKNAKFNRYIDTVELGVLAKAYGFNQRFKSQLLGNLNHKKNIKGVEEFVILQQAIYSLLIEKYPLLEGYL